MKLVNPLVIFMELLSPIYIYYQQQYFEALDFRFDQPGYAIYTRLPDLLLKAATGVHMSLICSYEMNLCGKDLNKHILDSHLQMLLQSYTLW